jgi:type VI secretion system protein ImpL
MHRLGKFPFVSLSKAQASRDLTNSEQASLEEVNALFAPGTGKLWTYYNENLKQWLVLQGSQYVLAPNAAGHVGPGFAQFFNRAALSPLRFTHPERRSPASTSLFARCPARGLKTPPWWLTAQRIPAGSTVQQFKWNAATRPSGFTGLQLRRSIAIPGNLGALPTCKYGPCHADHRGIELEFPLEISGRPLRLPDGTPKVVRFELSGPGAEVLAPGALSGQPCVTSVIK